MKKYDYQIDLNAEKAPAQILKRIGLNKTVLEVGCSSGSQTRILTNELNCKVTCVEIDEKTAEKAKEFCDNVIVGSIENIDLATIASAKTFDVITFSDVLEHLVFPSDTLRRVLSLLKDDGYILASIPNIVHASIIFEMIHGNFDYRRYGLLDDTHIKFFTKRSIIYTFENAGLVIEEVHRVLRKPKDTEFGTLLRTEQEKQIMDYIYANNDECETFQYIVKATKQNQQFKSGWTTSQDELDKLKKQIVQYQTAVDEKNQQIEKLNGQLTWIDNKFLSKVVKTIKHWMKG